MMLVWVPPPETFTQALGSEPGGGCPSIAVQIERPTTRAWDYEWTDEWRIATDNDHLGHGHAGILLTIDGKSCSLSWRRVEDLYREKIAGDFDEEFAKRQWRRVEQQRDPKVMLVATVAVLGGEIVEVP